MHLKEVISAASLGFILNGCITTSRPFYYDERISNQYEVIQEENSLAQHFLSNRPVSELSKNELEILRSFIEADYSTYLNQRIEFPNPYFSRTGHMLILTNLGDDRIIFSKNLYHESFNDIEKSALEFLAERYGPDFEDIIASDSNLFETAKSAIGSRELEEYFDQEHNTNPIYAAYVTDMSGYAIPAGFLHYVNLRPDIDSLQSLISTWEHEYAHTLIYNSMNLEYSFSLLGSYTGLSSNMDIISIHETSCNIISNRLQRLFVNHLDGQLLEDYNNSLEMNLLLEDSINSIVSDYKTISREQRLANRDEIFARYSRIIYDDTGLTISRINEARLALMSRYSGNKDIKEKLESILNEQGPNNFISLISFFYHKSDLDVAYSLSRRGKNIIDIVNRLQIKHARERENINF